MSLVIAAHNSSEIVIASDSLNRSTKTGLLQVDATIEKVTLVNPQLAYMITGTYASDKLQLMRDAIAQTQSATELDPAFWTLYDRTVKHMAIHTREGFRIGLAGFNADIPGFKCITVVYGRPIVAEGASANYYISGETGAVNLAERRIKASHIMQQPPTTAITSILTDIVTECIVAYPTILGEPIDTWVLHH